MDHSKHASEIFDQLAELYQSKYMDVAAYAVELDSFLGLLNSPSPSILEIACGPGNITRYVLNKKPGLNIMATDLAPKMIALARLNCPEAVFKVMDCRKINSIAGKFDGIIAGFCLPYLNSAELNDLVKDIAVLLKEGGVLYLSTIEGEYKNSGYKKSSTGQEVFMHYYRFEDIEPVFLQHHLKIISKRSVTLPENPHQDIDLLIIAVKQNGL